MTEWQRQNTGPSGFVWPWGYFSLTYEMADVPGRCHLNCHFTARLLILFYDPDLHENSSFQSLYLICVYPQ